MEKKIITMPMLVMVSLIFLSIGAMLSFTGCDDDDDTVINEEKNDTNEEKNDTNIPHVTGYKLEKEDVNGISTDNVSLWGIVGEDNLPSSVDLSEYLPPIGDQEEYGTCVAWASGYYYRTYLRAKALDLTKNELRQADNQFSPKDLFWALDYEDKPDGCDGTYISSALEKMKTRGIATLATVPYKNVDDGNCYNTPPNSWTQEANNYKIKEWQLIDVSNPISIKRYLSNGMPIVFGANVSYNFMKWKGNGIFKWDSQGDWFMGGHAMVICGFDDEKNAFRVVNSWGDDWGDNGYIWIDYSLMCGSFAKYGFVAESQEGGFDLEASYLDFSTDIRQNGECWSTIKYDIYNSGTQPILSSKDWSVVFIYQNVDNPKDSGYMFVDYYTDDFGEKGDTCTSWKINIQWGDPLKKFPTKIIAEAYSWNNVDVSIEEKVSHAVFHQDTRFSWTIKIPEKLNGDYKLFLAVDYFGKIRESDERGNNRLYVNNGNPVHFVNGVPTNVSKSSNFN